MRQPRNHKRAKYFTEYSSKTIEKLDDILYVITAFATSILIGVLFMGSALAKDYPKVGNFLETYIPYYLGFCFLAVVAMLVVGIVGRKYRHKVKKYYY